MPFILLKALPHHKFHTDNSMPSIVIGLFQKRLIDDDLETNAIRTN